MRCAFRGFRPVGNRPRGFLDINCRHFDRIRPKVRMGQGNCYRASLFDLRVPFFERV
ncbi:hypothetical protein PCPL58_p4078 (plasmid) [Pseudomonas cerasi]|nr:hypothetical protein PCPL58_p4078 [Pseudomonas cerasi]